MARQEGAPLHGSRDARARYRPGAGRHLPRHRLCRVHRLAPGRRRCSPRILRWWASTPSRTTTPDRRKNATWRNAGGAATVRGSAEPGSRAWPGAGVSHPGEVNGVFHLAARPGVRTSWGSSFAAYTQRQPPLDAAGIRGCGESGGESRLRILIIRLRRRPSRTPLGEDGAARPPSPVRREAKVACEALAGAYAAVGPGLDAVAPRYFSVYGPRQRPDMASARSCTPFEENRPFRVIGGGDPVA